MKEQPIELIPIAQIHIANPRPRSRGRWQMIVANIREVGLKKPITVVRRSEPDADGKLFDLVCGQGRIEAFLALGETTIPAVVTEASREDQFLMSLVENIARRPPSKSRHSPRSSKSPRTWILCGRYCQKDRNGTHVRFQYRPFGRTQRSRTHRSRGGRQIAH